MHATIDLLGVFQPQAMCDTALSVLIALLIVAVGAVHNAALEVINRDVVIVGGGASGAHAAVKLRDMGKSVVLVEKRDKLVSEDAAVLRKIRHC